MTRLDAINQMLTGIGEAPVTTVDSQHPDVIVAVVVLARINQEIQEAGYWFNTSNSLDLQKELTTGKIPLPSNTLSADPVDTGLKYIQRDGFLYDIDNDTYQIEEDKVQCRVVFLLDFDIVPPAAQHFIAARSTYELHLSEVGDENKLNRLNDLATRSRMRFRSAELKAGDYNARKSPSASRLLSRLIPYIR